MDPVSNENVPSNRAPNLFSIWWIVGGVVCLLLLADLGFLHWKVLTQESQPVTSEKTTAMSDDLVGIPEHCPAACLSTIKEATSSVIPTPAPSRPQQVVVTQPSVSVPQEFYIPIGGGTTEKKEWTEITGAEVTIDTANYSGKRTVTWEAALKVLSGNGRTYARLKNMSTKLAITDSQISASADPAVQVVSGQFPLAEGSVTYRVEMYTTTGYRATLESGRIKIMVE